MADDSTTLAAPQGDTGAGQEGAGQAGGDASQQPQLSFQDQGGQKAPDAPQTQDGTQQDAKPDDTKADKPAYKWQAPDDLKSVPLDEKSVEGFAKFAKDQGMTEKQFQASLELYARQTKASFEAFETANRKNVETLAQEWGADYEDKIEVAKKGLEAFAEPGLIKMLEATGAAFHPSLVKTFERIGRAVREDSARGRSRKLDPDIQRTEGGMPMLSFKGMK